MQRALSRTCVITWGAVKLRNQCNRVIGYSVCASSNPDDNGEAWLLRSLADRIQVFFDVGANQGQWTALALEFAHPRVKGVLFEPARNTAKNLANHFRAEPRVEIIEAALSDRIGARTLYESALSSETTSLWQSTNNTPSEIYEVKCTTVDEEARYRKLDRIDLVKVDTEGNDLFVMWGAESLLRKQAIGAIQFEYGSGWIAAGSTLLRAVRYLEDFGYAVFLLKPDGLEAFDPVWLGEFFGYSNLVALVPHFAAIPRLSRKAY